MKLPFSLPLLAVLCTAGGLAVGPVRATSVVAPSFDDLVTKADCIVTGKVTDLRSEWTGDGPQRHIVTFVKLDVLRVLKGEAASPFTLRVLGGTVGTQTMEVADAPAFRVGEREVLFVHNNGRQFIPLVGIMHGQYRIDDADRVADHAGRPVAQVEDIGKPESLDDAVRRRALTHAGQGNGAAVALSRADFEAKIIAKVEATHTDAH